MIMIFISMWLLLHYVCRKQRNLPPGPFSLPIVGTLPWIGTDFREPFEELKKKYGDVFTVYLGSKPAVVLCSHNSIKEAFVKCGNAFSGRPQHLFFIKELTLGRGNMIHFIFCFTF